MNVSSLLSKIDKLTDVTNYIKTAITDIKESKLDSSVTNIEVKINGYSIIWINRNRNDGDCACYVRKDLCFNVNNFFSKFY